MYSKRFIFFKRCSYQITRTCLGKRKKSNFFQNGVNAVVKAVVDIKNDNRLNIEAAAIQREMVVTNHDQ